MIKKILLLGLISAPGCLWATQTISFVTELVAPVGTFATLEVTDATHSVQARNMSYGNSNSPNADKIILRGNHNETPFLGDIKLQNESVLSGSASQLKITMTQSELGDFVGIKMGDKLKITGGGLAGGIVYLEGRDLKKNRILVGDKLTSKAEFFVQGAKITNLGYGRPSQTPVTEQPSHTDRSEIDPTNISLFWSTTVCTNGTEMVDYTLQSN